MTNKEMTQCTYSQFIIIIIIIISIITYIISYTFWTMGQGLSRG
jgi:hypothetical protein